MRRANKQGLYNAIVKLDLRNSGPALLDYNIFNCCLLRDLLAAAAQGSGAVLAVLV